MEEAWPRPGPLAAEAFDTRCDMTMRPFNLGEMMKDKMDAVIGSDDAAAVRRVVHEARTRFGGHTDVQAHLTSLRIYEAELSKQRGDAGRPQLGKPPAGASPRPRRSRSVERLPSEDRELEAEDPQPAAASATPLRRRGSLPQKAFVMPVTSGTGKAHIAVIGAGYVGARIATELLICGATVSVFDIAGVAHVEEVVWATLDDALRAGYIEARDQPAIFARLSAVRTIGEAVSEARLVCECVADNLQVRTYCPALSLPAVLEQKLATSFLSKHVLLTWAPTRLPAPPARAGEGQGVPRNRRELPQRHDLRLVHAEPAPRGDPAAPARALAAAADWTAVPRANCWDQPGRGDVYAAGQ
jgi:hypothetical protein